MKKRCISYRGHVIYYDTDCEAFSFAMKRNGTDTYFGTLDEAYDAIDEIEDNKPSNRKESKL